jgi:thiosulfate/3-mercaptopyruvate sulfurtransferase
VEAWQKVFVDQKKFVDGDPHAKVANCIQCHGGAGGVDDMAAAHQGVVRDPTADQDSVDRLCGACHKEIAAAQANSLHFDSHGYDTIVGQRLNPEMHAAWETAEGNHCSSCHTTCGQCHVSQPTSVGGGLISGHQFKGTQAFTRTCTGCHGSRVNNEYTGRNEGIPADVHWTQAGMPCFKCHSGESLHGMTGEQTERYDGKQDPSCLDCHPDVASGKSEVQQHAIHGEKVACQVCHSVEYKSCYSCHTQTNEKGTPYFKIEPAEMGFKIGLNPKKSEERPWNYVVLRHAPVDPESFAFYGKDVLSNFDALPTWKYATPHNIQRKTPQTESCNSCHGNADLFLSADDLRPYEVEANQAVIPQQLPPKMGQ